MMKHIDMLRQELSNRGINAGIEEVEIIKNSIPCTGIRVITPDNPQVTPIVYYSSDETVESIADRIRSVMQAASPKWDIDLLSDPDFIRSHLYLAVTRRHGEAGNVLRREYLNVDVIMKLAIGDDDLFGTPVIKVTKDLLSLSGVSEEDAWQSAGKNSENSVEVLYLAAYFQWPLGDLNMYAAACNEGKDGASVLCFTDVFRTFCEEHDMESLIILPSSTQEVIIVPETGMPPAQDLAAMVEDINYSVVDPLLQLDPVVYRYSYQDNAISIVAAM